jgi:hypothetical protein
MIIKIDWLTRNLYSQLCPISSSKCESVYELDYKIQRCIDLGKVTKASNGLKLIQYYRNQFHVKNNQIIDIVKTKHSYEVNEKSKNAHYNKSHKVVV